MFAVNASAASVASSARARASPARGRHISSFGSVRTAPAPARGAGVDGEHDRVNVDANGCTREVTTARGWYAPAIGQAPEGVSLSQQREVLMSQQIARIDYEPGAASHQQS